METIKGKLRNMDDGSGSVSIYIIYVLQIRLIRGENLWKK